MANTVEKVIKTAINEVGYLEKKTNAELESKTANAGKGNFTKYAKYLDAIEFFNTPKNGYNWCAVFIAWLFVTAFGAAAAQKLLYLPAKSMGASCTYLAGRFKANGRLYSAPKVGDLIFFTSNAGVTYYHIGFVYKVDKQYVYTVEGNTSGGSEVVANGGGVALKRYSITYGYSQGWRYGRPLYDAAAEQETVPAEVNVEMWTSKDEKGRILDIALKVDYGSIWYQVHTIKDNRWLPKVTGFDKNDFINGYAGNHTPIDAIRVYYNTPKGEPYKQARYAVQTEKSGTRWLPEQVDDYTTDGMDGYAGNLSEAITGFRWRVDDE